MASQRKPIAERFWNKVEKSEGCWKWHGAKTSGYGYLTIGGRNEGVMRAHRLSYEIHKGPVPDGLVVRHKCDNPECTNPDHLEVGTRAENSLDMVLRKRHHSHGKTHCKNGHEYSEKNTFFSKRGTKYCKVCKREAQRARLRKERGSDFGKQRWVEKTHCPHGHEFSVENTYCRPDGYKECKTCRSERVARFKAKSQV